MNQTLAYKAALEWYLDIGVDEALSEEPSDKTAMPELPKAANSKQTSAKASDTVPKISKGHEAEQSTQVALGASEAITQAAEIAKSCNTIEELKTAITEFEGLSIKKTASNMIFADGDEQADIMLIGEAPSADEDRQGRWLM